MREIVEGWRNLLKAVVIMLGFMFLFASLGVQVSRVKNPFHFMVIVLHYIHAFNSFLFDPIYME